MTKIWSDDPAGLYANVRAIRPVDLGTAQNPLGTVYAQNIVAAGISGDTVLPFNDFLEAISSAGAPATLNLLKGDANDNTVLNAATGELILFQVGEADILRLSSTDLVYTPSTFQIRAASSDTTDNQLLILAGGGLGGPGREDRGAYINIAGNENALAGQIQLIAGDTAVGAGAGDIDLRCTGTLGAVTLFTQDLSRIAVTADGDVKLDATNGQNLVLQRASTGIQIGTSGLPDATILAAFGTYPAILAVTNANSFDSVVTGSFGANAAGPTLKGFKTRSASSAAPATTIVQVGDNLLTLGAYGADGVAYKIGASLTFQVGSTPGVNSIPTDAILSVVKAAGTSQTQIARIFSTGNFAITSESTLNADVNAAWGQSPFLVIANNNTADAFINIGNGNNAVGAHSHFAKTRSTGTDANTIVAVSDELSAQTSYGADGVTYRAGTKISSVVDGAPGVAVLPSRLEFHTAITNGVLRRYYIDSAGVLNNDSSNGGNIRMNRTGTTLSLAQAANGKAGTVVLNGATPVAAGNTSITAGSVVVFTLKTVGGTVGAYPAIQTITPATGFTVAGTAGDTSTYNYAILETA